MLFTYFARMRSKSLVTAVAAVALTAMVPVPRVPAQENDDRQPAFRADVRLVLHGIAVLDAEGRPVPDLSIEELRVSEDGVLQELTLFLAPNDSPLDIVLAIDASASLAPWAATVRRAARTFLLSLDTDDCVYLLPFNGEVGPGTWGAPYDPVLGRRIDGIFLEGTTALYDAVIEGLAALDRPSGGSGCGGELELDEFGTPRRRRAIVLLSDGEDRASQRRFDEVLDLAREASVPIFPVVVGGAGANDRLRAVLDALAGNTGGTVITSTDAAELKRAYDDVDALLRASYLVGYRPQQEADPGTWHEVQVRSRRPSYRLVHRDRYFR